MTDIEATEYDELSQKVRHLISSASGVSLSEISLDAPLATYGIDSLLEMELMVEAEELFGHLEVWNLRRPTTGRDLVNYALRDRTS
jgi:hypothetical protein